ADHPTKLVACVAGAAIGGIVPVVGHIDLVQGTHELRGTPSLIDPQIGDEIGCLKAAVSTWKTVGPDNSTATNKTGPWRALDSNLGGPPHLGGNRARKAIAKLRGIAGDHPAAIARIRRGERTPVRGRRGAVEIEERL